MLILVYDIGLLIYRVEFNDMHELSHLFKIIFSLEVLTHVKSYL